MRRLSAAILVLALVLAACGGAGGHSGPTRRAPVPRGPRGERIGAEPAGSARLDRGACEALAAAVRAAAGRPAHARSRPGPPLSRCSILGPGIAVNVYLDTAHAAHQRYENRMVEQAQFGAPNPALVPHDVPGVGERAASGHGASWVPAFSTLFAVRGGRFLTVACSVAGWPRPRRLRAAAALARRAFALAPAG
ncbi:MAG: hypothetical protein U0R71_13270 [Solirubrobacterales bacterium]